MVERTDKLFGILVITCHAYLFCNMCGNVYFLFRDLSASNTMLDPPTLFFYLLFPSFRFIQIDVLIVRTKRSDEWWTLSSIDSSKRNYPCPSGYYYVKQSIFLTAVNLIVTYTIILLQTNNTAGASSNSIAIFQNSNCACVCHSWIMYCRFIIRM